MATVQTSKRSSSSRDPRYFFAKLEKDRDGNQCDARVSDLKEGDSARREFIPLDREDRYIFADSGCYSTFGARAPRSLIAVPSDGVSPSGDCYDPSGNEWMTREAGWRTVASLNAQELQGMRSWFVLLEVGNELAPQILIFGCGLVGELKVERTFAVRVVHPTAAEIAKFGGLKGGDA